MATKLSLYNGALAVLGERKVTLAENREPRHKLDDIWDRRFIDRVLRAGQWNFAMRAIEMIPDPSFTTSFGYQFAYQKPTDHVRTAGICQDEYFNIPLTHYTVEAGVWYADIEPLYVRYVSNGNDYGGNLADWPSDFENFAEHYLAFHVAKRLTGYDRIGIDDLKEDLKGALKAAKNTDAMEQPARFQPMGSWARSRRGLRGNAHDRGKTGQLIG